MSVTPSVRLWKPLDSEFTPEEMAQVAEALGLPEDQINWDFVNEYLDEIPGHSMIGTPADD